MLLKWKCHLELISRQTNIKVFNNYLLEQVKNFFYLVGYALEIIPKTLATNCGMDVVRTITELRAKHAEKGNTTFGIDGNKKKIADMN